MKIFLYHFIANASMQIQKSAKHESNKATVKFVFNEMASYRVEKLILKKSKFIFIQKLFKSRK